MIFLLVNHNFLYTILGTYPPGPFRNNHNSPKKISIFPAFPATLFQRGNFQHAKFFQRGKFAGKANCSCFNLSILASNFVYIKYISAFCWWCFSLLLSQVTFFKCFKELFKHIPIFIIFAKFHFI